jgi:CheY-like chemotaxis protein
MPVMYTPPSSPSHTSFSLFPSLSSVLTTIRDGYAATNEIRKIEKTNNLDSVIIIAVTAHATNSDKQQCIEAGMNDCIFLLFFFLFSLTW